MVAANLTSLISTLITGLHILHYNGVLDAYGHMSVSLLILLLLNSIQPDQIRHALQL